MLTIKYYLLDLIWQFVTQIRMSKVLGKEKPPEVFYKKGVRVFSQFLEIFKNTYFE